MSWVVLLGVAAAGVLVLGVVVTVVLIALRAGGDKEDKNSD